MKLEELSLGMNVTFEYEENSGSGYIVILEPSSKSLITPGAKEILVRTLFVHTFSAGTNITYIATKYPDAKDCLTGEKLKDLDSEVLVWLTETAILAASWPEDPPHPKKVVGLLTSLAQEHCDEFNREGRNWAPN